MITGNPSAEVPYPGKDIFIFNNKAGNLTLKHDGSGTAQCKFFFIDETDLIIPPGGKVWLKYGPSYCEIIFKSWSDNVIEGYFNGTNFYTDAGFTNLITPESSKIYLNLAVTPATQYRWSGSAYVQIGGDSEVEQQLQRYWYSMTANTLNTTLMLVNNTNSFTISGTASIVPRSGTLYYNSIAMNNYSFSFRRCVARFSSPAS